MCVECSRRPKGESPDADEVTVPPLTKWEWYNLQYDALASEVSQTALVKLVDYLTSQEERP